MEQAGVRLQDSLFQRIKFHGPVLYHHILHQSSQLHLYLLHLGLIQNLDLRDLLQYGIVLMEK